MDQTTRATTRAYRDKCISELKERKTPLEREIYLSGFFRNIGVDHPLSHDPELLFCYGDAMVQTSFGDKPDSKKLQRARAILQKVRGDGDIERTAVEYVGSLSLILAQVEGDPERKKAHYQQGKENNQVLLHLMLQHYAEGEYEEAAGCSLQYLVQSKDFDEKFCYPLVHRFLVRYNSTRRHSTQREMVVADLKSYIREESEAYLANKMIATYLCRDGYVQEGLRLLEKSKEQAKRCRRDALSYVPPNSALESKIDFHLGQIDKGIVAMCKEAIRKYPKDEADYGERLLNAQPQNLETILFLARKYFESENWEKSHAMYSKVVQMMKNDPKKRPFHTFFSGVDYAGYLFTAYQRDSPNHEGWKFIDKEVNEVLSAYNGKEGGLLCELVFKLPSVRNSGIRFNASHERIALFGFDPLSLEFNNIVYKKIVQEIKEIIEIAKIDILPMGDKNG